MLGTKVEYTIDNTVKAEDTMPVKNEDSKFNEMVASHFKDKLAFNSIRAEKKTVHELILSKLKVDTDVDTYTEYDFGGDGLVAIFPPYSTKNFETSTYVDFLNKNDLFMKAKKLCIVKISKNNFTTETSFDKETNDTVAENSRLSIIAAGIADFPLYRLIDYYIGLSTVSKILRNQIDKRLIRIIKMSKKKFGTDGLDNAKIVCIDYPFSGNKFEGSISFKRENKIEVDKDRAYELVPDSFTSKEKNEILKSESRIVASPLIKIIKKPHLVH